MGNNQHNVENIMEMKPYDWQKEFLEKYQGRGIIKAFAGTGKTYAAILLIKNRDYKRVIVAVPTRKLKTQWLSELRKHKVDNVYVETFHILSKWKYGALKCDLLVVDECHRSTSPVFKNLYSFIDFDQVLGLSATPNKKSMKYCGRIVIDVPLEDAKISNFTVYFHSIELDSFEREQYDELSDGIRRYIGRMRSSGEDDKAEFREKLDSMIFRRRSIVYSADSRIPQAVELIEKNDDKPTLVICKRIEQANMISKITGYPVYHSEKTDEKAMDDFQNDRIPVLISVGMLAEGYDKRNIECLIIVSTAITESYHIQSIGRAVRLPDDADIHILLARNTTDEKLLQFRDMYNYEIVGRFSPSAFKAKNPWREEFYEAQQYSIDSRGRIYQRKKDIKEYYKDNPIAASLERLFNYRGGKFRVTRENLVLAKRGGKIQSLGILQEPLEKIRPTNVKKISKKSY